MDHISLLGVGKTESCTERSTICNSLEVNDVQSTDQMFQSVEMYCNFYFSIHGYNHFAQSICFWCSSNNILF